METIAGTARMPPDAAIASIDMAAKAGLSKKRLRQTVKAMEDAQEEYKVRWQAIRDFQLPFIGEFIDRGDTENRAKRRDTKIWNSAAWESCQVFAAGIMSGLTPQNRRWFRLSFSDRALSDDAEASRILDERMEILNDVLDKSNFYNAIHTAYLELPFGQAPLGVFPDREHGVHFVPYTIGSYMLSASADGNVDVFCRKRKMTASQLVEKFGEEVLPEAIRREAKETSGMKASHTVYWIVQPNSKKAEDKPGRIYLPYVSAYWLENSRDDEWLYIGGFNEWPVPVGRYLITGTDTYGKGPGWFAEGDAKELQLLERDKMALVELTVKPVITADEETANRGISLTPGDITIQAKGEQGGAKPLFQVAAHIEQLEYTIEKVENRIKRAYAADLFLMMDQQTKQMTAREVVERMQEKMQQLGPVVQRMQFEFLSKIIERVYNILDRAGVFPPVEDEETLAAIADKEIRIEYISPLAQAQKMSGLVNIEQALEFVGQIAQFAPEVLDKVNYPEAVDRYIDMVGAPAAIKKSKEEFQAIQEQKAEEAAKAKELQQAAAVAQVAAPAAQAARNFSDAAKDGNPALAQLLGVNTLGLPAGGESNNG